MQISKVMLVYFSATNVSKQYAHAMAEGLGKPVEVYDLTMPAGRSATALQCDGETLVIVSMPVYSGRVIPHAVPFLTAMTGAQTPCIVLGTYGNRHYDDALVELADLMTANGFVVVGAGALVGRHSFSDEIAGSRPNAEDLAQAGAFAQAVVNKDVAPLALDEIPGNRPYKEGGKPNDFRSTPTAACVGCKLCAKQCPMGVIDSTDVSALAPGKSATDCILCNRCVVHCPVHARVFDFDAYRQMVSNCIANFGAPDKENLYIQ